MATPAGMGRRRLRPGVAAHDAGTARLGILFIFLAVVSGARLPERLALTTLAVLAALAGGAMLVGGGNDAGVISVVTSAAGIGFLFVLLARLAHANIELQAAQDELAAAAVSEERGALRARPARPARP